MKLSQSEIDALCAKSRAVAVHCRIQLPLRQMWNATLTERIPDDMRSLVERLK